MKCWFLEKGCYWKEQLRANQAGLTGVGSDGRVDLEGKGKRVAGGQGGDSGWGAESNGVKEVFQFEAEGLFARKRVLVK